MLDKNNRQFLDEPALAQLVAVQKLGSALGAECQPALSIVTLTGQYCPIVSTMTYFPTIY